MDFIFRVIIFLIIYKIHSQEHFSFKIMSAARAFRVANGTNPLFLSMLEGNFVLARRIAHLLLGMLHLNDNPPGVPTQEASLE